MPTGAVARKEPAELHPTAMTSKLGPLLRILGRMFFRKVAFDEQGAEIVRNAARRGTVVYVMRDRSYIGYLFFNWAYVIRGLPLAQFANGLGSLFLHPFRVIGRWLLGRGRIPGGHEGLRHTVERGDGALLFLRKPASLTARDPDFRMEYVRELIRIQRNMERPILLVPQLLLWSRAPERYRKSFVDMVFGEPDAPGRLRGVWLFLRNHERAFAKVAEPVNLKELCERFPNQSDEVLAKKVRWMVLHYLSRERQVVLGPILKSPRRIKAEVMRTRVVREAIEETAAAEGRTVKELEKRSRKMLNEMAANISVRAIRAYCWLLSHVFNRIYDGIEVDEQGLERVREAMRKMPVVLVPSHRSHIDYLLLSYLFFTNGMTPPHIAAGKNLSFWPMGYVFRKGGAFFLRRSFKGDRLYSVMFRAYMQKLLREGFPMEFFIEGGRSRSGKMLYPRVGLLSMVVDAIFDGQVRDIAVVPIHITYQKIIEGRAYSHELLGGRKEREDFKQLLAVPKVLRSRYGQVYVDFAEPIPLAAYCASRGWRPEQPIEREDRRQIVDELGLRITYDIGRVARVAPSGIAAAVLLGHGRRGITRDGFLEAARRLRDLLRDKHVRLPKSMSGPSTDVVMEEAIKLHQQNKLLEIRNQGDTIVYAVPDRARLQLDYYKNSILYGVVGEAMVACALLGEVGPRSPRDQSSEAVSRVRLRDRARQLFRLLRYEFIYRPGVELDVVIDDALNTLQERGLCEVVEGMVQPLPEARAELRLLSGLCEGFVEAYAVAAHCLRDVLTGGLGERDLVERILEHAQEMFLTGDVRRFEACSQISFQNAVRYFRDERFLEISSDSAEEEEHLRLADDLGEEQALDGLAREIRDLLPPADF